MKILQVAHSFVPYAMAGVEVYTYNLSKELSKRHNVYVFFRINDPQKKEYALLRQGLEGFDTYAINRTFKRCSSFENTYQDSIVNGIFGQLLDEIKPDVAHIQHLSFLSAGIADEARRRGVPVFYTLHDYWLICHRGQLIRDDLTVCAGASGEICAGCHKYLLCLNSLTSYLYYVLRRSMPVFLLGFLKRHYWFIPKKYLAAKVDKRKEAIGNLCLNVDKFLAPSHYIKDRFIDYGVPAHKIIYSPCGFDTRNFLFFQKNKSSKMRFGFLGAFLPTKGIDILIAAFRLVRHKDIKLYIYGTLFAYSSCKTYPAYLKKLAKPDARIYFKGRYENKDVAAILSDIDALIVPSIWPENSPFVIQEAFLAKTPVIASRIGGMPELVKDGVNGLLFNPGDVEGLRQKIEYVAANPDVLEEFRQNIQEVKSIEENAKEMEEIYSGLINSSQSLSYDKYLNS